MELSLRPSRAADQLEHVAVWRQWLRRKPRWSSRCVFVAAFALARVALAAEPNAELNRILEQNASSAAYARVCDEEPMSEQLKANTMMLLAVTGMEAHNVQLGSGKFNDVMRGEIANLRKAKSVDCATKVQEARERLAATQSIIRGSHPDGCRATEPRYASRTRVYFRCTPASRSDRELCGAAIPSSLASAPHRCVRLSSGGGRR